MESAEIRSRWLRFFEERDHAVVPSASLLARRPQPAARQRRHGARSSRTSSARSTPPYPRATSVQKCVRTLDIEEVGKTTRHGTVLPDERQLLLRRLLQGAGHPARVGAAHASRSPTAATASPSPALATVYQDDDEAVRSGSASPACPTSGSCGGQGGQLLVDGRARARADRAARSSSTAALSTARRATSRVERTATSRSGTSSSCSSSCSAGAQQGGLRHRRRPARQEHRHRHGPRARRLPAAGRGQPLRDRRGPPGPRPGGRADRKTYGADHEADVRLRVVADHVAQRADDHRRRRHPRQRGSRLRPAPGDAPGGPLDAAARRRRARRCR